MNLHWSLTLGKKNQNNVNVIDCRQFIIYSNAATCRNSTYSSLYYIYCSTHDYTSGVINILGFMSLDNWQMRVK